ncbi:hypothetical protein [Polymorphobacter megasporae]|uniref:hypothetical protein n=1 Tax=Glacieibacterium megasporae TaxID=2835787 RepID=UPI001C1E7167|nr:hypothetical protein [Polymorphobacter megasporae]UAJ11192.1 hypothetical protein KTC28_05665 [Polymorphobacter megasporae]
MSETVLDYVVKSRNGTWSVFKRTQDSRRGWLKTYELSCHATRETAVAEMRARNLAHVASQPE